MELLPVGLAQGPWDCCPWRGVSVVAMLSNNCPCHYLLHEQTSAWGLSHCRTFTSRPPGSRDMCQSPCWIRPKVHQIWPSLCSGPGKLTRGGLTMVILPCCLSSVSACAVEAFGAPREAVSSRVLPAHIIANSEWLLPNLAAMSNAAFLKREALGSLEVCSSSPNSKD